MWFWVGLGRFGWCGGVGGDDVGLLCVNVLWVGGV